MTDPIRPIPVAPGRRVAARVSSGLRRLAAAALALAALALAPPASAQLSEPTGPLRITVSEGVLEPLPIALPPIAADGPRAQALAKEVQLVLTTDLESSGLFRVIDEIAYLVPGGPVNARPDFAPWRAINADALGVAEAAIEGDGRLAVSFQLWDVSGGAPLGDGFVIRAAPGDARRIAHRIADRVHLQLTGEPGYFDSRIAFVAESGPKGNRVKRIATMDHDGADVRFLTDGSELVLTPRFAPDGARVAYTTYAGGAPRVVVQDVASGARELLGRFPAMSFAPRFSPDGTRVALSLSEGGGTDLFALTVADGSLRRLTAGPGIETAPSWSPDGRRIAFESDAGGSPQIYVMPADGGEARRISFGDGRYGTPVWSPRGDLIAFTKQLGGRFHIGVMRTDGTQERLLTASYLDEAPTWSPNGRVLMFFRETPGPSGAPSLWRVDATGRNLRQVPTPGPASDPSWSPLLP